MKNARVMTTVFILGFIVGCMSPARSLRAEDHVPRLVESEPGAWFDALEKNSDKRTKESLFLSEGFEQVRTVANQFAPIWLRLEALFEELKVEMANGEQVRGPHRGLSRSRELEIRQELRQLLQNLNEQWKTVDSVAQKTFYWRVSTAVAIYTTLIYGLPIAGLFLMGKTPDSALIAATVGWATTLPSIKHMFSPSEQRNRFLIGEKQVWRSFLKELRSKGVRLSKAYPKDDLTDTFDEVVRIVFCERALLGE